jgi:phage terminase small subunit
VADLTPKQARFVEEYLIDLNATDAARRAGYSAKTAEQQGPRLLGNVGVAAAIQAAISARSARTQVTADRVVEELARLGFSDMREFAEWGAAGVKLRNSDTLPDDAARCVAEVSQTITEGGGSLKFKLHDKKGALELLGRHLGMFNDKLDMTTGGQPMAFTLGIGDKLGDRG